MGSTVERPPVQGLPGATAVLRVGYDGTGFSGYAIQEKQPHVRTVAGELRTALRMLLRRDVSSPVQAALTPVCTPEPST